MGETKTEVPEPKVDDLGGFDSMSTTQLGTVIEQMTRKVGQIFEKHRVDGDVAFEKISADEGQELQDLNIKLASARQRYEVYLTQKGLEDQAKRLQTYMAMPDFEAAKMFFPKGGGDPDPKPISMGEAWIQSKAYKSYVEDGVKGLEAMIDVRFKATKATLGTDDALAGVDQDFEPEILREPGIVEVLFADNNISPLIPNITTTLNSLEYMVETVTSQGAVETEEGALATEADVSYEPATEVIRHIPVLLPITNILMNDVPAMRGIVNQRLLTFVGNREDQQILLGDGIGQNIEGLVNRTGVQTTTWPLGAGTAVQLLEATLSMQTQVMEVFQTPSDAIMQAATWEYLRLVTDSQGNYLMGPAITAGVRRVWGLPVTLNQRIDDRLTIGNNPILIGDFRTAATIFRRQGIALSASDSHTDTFGRGILTLKAESRIGLVVWRPSGFSMIDVLA